MKEQTKASNVIKLEHTKDFNYIPWVKGLITFENMTENQLKLWNEYRNFTSQVIATMFKDEYLNWEDWPGMEYYPDNSNPRYFEYRVIGESVRFDIDKLQYIVDVCNATNREIRASIDDCPQRIMFFTHNLIFEGRHIKVKNVDPKQNLYAVTIDPEKEVKNE